MKRIFSIKMLGTDIHSAYYVLTNNSSDTDTTALRLGAMTTFIVESGAYYFGIGNNSDSFDAVTIEKNDIDIIINVFFCNFFEITLLVLEK